MEVIKKLLEKSLSNTEILKIIDGKANLDVYSNIHKYKSLNQLMGKYKACVLLYETKKNFGHWCCVFMINDYLCEFFDPYGLWPDTELKFINKEYRIASNQDYPYLTRLMIESPYKLSFNHFKFQELKKGVNSCGRWVAVRLLYRDMSLNKFIKIFGKNRQYNNDIYVTALTSNI